MEPMVPSARHLGQIYNVVSVGDGENVRIYKTMAAHEVREWLETALPQALITNMIQHAKITPQGLEFMGEVGPKGIHKFLTSKVGQEYNSANKWAWLGGPFYPFDQGLDRLQRLLKVMPLGELLDASTVDPQKLLGVGTPEAKPRAASRSPSAGYSGGVAAVGNCLSPSEDDSDGLEGTPTPGSSCGPRFGRSSAAFAAAPFPPLGTPVSPQRCMPEVPAVHLTQMPKTQQPAGTPESPQVAQAAYPVLPPQQWQQQKHLPAAYTPTAAPVPRWRHMFSVFSSNGQPLRGSPTVGTPILGGGQPSSHTPRVPRVTLAQLWQEPQFEPWRQVERMRPAYEQRQQQQQAGNGQSVQQYGAVQPRQHTQQEASRTGGMRSSFTTAPGGAGSKRSREPCDEPSALADTLNSHGQDAPAPADGGAPMWAKRQRVQASAAYYYGSAAPGAFGAGPGSKVTGDDAAAEGACMAEQLLHILGDRQQERQRRQQEPAFDVDGLFA